MLVLVKFYRGRSVMRGKRGGVTRPHIERGDAPFPRRSLTDAEQSRAVGLEQRLKTRPLPEEIADTRGRGSLRRKVALRNRGVIGERPYALEIDPHLPVSRHGDECEIARVREVEEDVSVVSEIGFTARMAREFEEPRGIPAQHVAQRGMRPQIAPAQNIGGKSLCVRRFFRRGHQHRAPVKPHLPHVNVSH